MKKKTIAVMLLAAMQSAFAIQLMDGKYINFEDFVRETNEKVVNKNGLADRDNEKGCRTIDKYKWKCVSGTIYTRRYFTNAVLKKAFDKARELKGIGVYLPPGVWNFADQIVVPHGMTLKGSYDRPHNVTETDLSVDVQGGQMTVTWDKTDGTNIACSHGINSQPADPLNQDQNACIALQGTATLDGVNVFYPEQSAPDENSAFEPNPYSWTISCQSTPGVTRYSNDGSPYIDPAPLLLARCSVKNTTLVNSYAGIDLSGANDHYIKGVNMTVFKEGIRVDGITSQGAIEDVNIHHQFCLDYYKITGVYALDESATYRYNKIEAYILEHMVGMEFGRVDWAWINNVFIYKANKGFYFKRGINGNTFFRAVPSVDIQNSGCDICVDAVYAEEINSSIGVNFSNSNLLGRIYTGPNNYGPIRITNSHLALAVNLYSLTKLYDHRNMYDLSHVEVGEHTVMQITNSEILEYVEDSKGVWCGSAFDVKGKLLIDNSAFAWPNLFGINFDQLVIGGIILDPVDRFRVSDNAVLLASNLLIRGDNQLRVNSTTTATVDTAHTAYDLSQYHPIAR